MEKEAILDGHTGVAELEAQMAKEKNRQQGGFLGQDYFPGIGSSLTPKERAEQERFRLERQEERAQTIRAGALEAAIRVVGSSTNPALVLMAAKKFEAYLNCKPQQEGEEAALSADTESQLVEAVA